MAKQRNALDPVTSVFRALGDPTRARLFAALQGGERCACELTALVGLAPSTVSRHLAVLRAAGLAATRKEGRWMHYRPRAPDAAAAARCAAAALEALAPDAGLARDRRRLAAIGREGREALCRRRRSRGAAGGPR